MIHNRDCVFVKYNYEKENQSALAALTKPRVEPSDSPYTSVLQAPVHLHIVHSKFFYHGKISR